MSGELSPPPDFTNNKAWFDWKLLTKGDRVNNCKSMGDETYRKTVERICKKHNIPTKHYSHIGRVFGPAFLEFAEVEEELIRNLGNWNPNVFEQRYSKKIPIKALKAMAEFANGDLDGHYNKRVADDPAIPNELRKMIFATLDTDGEIQKCRDAEELDGKPRHTAIAFLKFLDDCRDIIIQDSAAIWILHPERKEHHVFKQPVFQTEEFHVSITLYTFF